MRQATRTLPRKPAAILAGLVLLGFALLVTPGDITERHQLAIAAGTLAHIDPSPLKKFDKLSLIRGNEAFPMSLHLQTRYRSQVAALEGKPVRVLYETVNGWHYAQEVTAPDGTSGLHYSEYTRHRVLMNRIMQGLHWALLGGVGLCLLMLVSEPAQGGTRKLRTRCPHCRTTFTHIDDSGITGDKQFRHVVFRCPKCAHTFGTQEARSAFLARDTNSPDTSALPPRQDR